MWQVQPTSIEGNDGIISLEDVDGDDSDDVQRIQTGPWDICFGPGPSECYANHAQGLPIGGIIAIGGGPGAGKSTLAMQILPVIVQLFDCLENVLYVAKEERPKTYKARAIRLGIPKEIRKKIQLYPLQTETDLGLVIGKYKPKAIVIDSLQKVAPELEDQVSFCATLRPYADEYNCPIIVISQVNKDLDIAGLMALQHEVDTIMTLTIPTMNSEVRELIPLKNRFGEANFIKHLLMTAKGLVDYNIEESIDDDEEDD